MSIFLKVLRRINPLDRSKSKYYAYAKKRGEITLRELAELVAEITALSVADVEAAITALVLVIPQALSDGKSVHLGDLGHFRISIKSRGELTADDVDAHSILSAHIIFTPSKTFAKFLKELHYTKQK